jgi:hypothetical protein
MMWPIWKLPLAYGSAVVTKSWRGIGDFWGTNAVEAQWARSAQF